jgi:hypothetical protein
MDNIILPGSLVGLLSRMRGGAPTAPALAKRAGSIEPAWLRSGEAGGFFVARRSQIGKFSLLGDFPMNPRIQLACNVRFFPDGLEFLGSLFIQ